MRVIPTMFWWKVGLVLQFWTSCHAKGDQDKPHQPDSPHIFSTISVLEIHAEANGDNIDVFDVGRSRPIQTNIAISAIQFRAQGLNDLYNRKI